LVHGYLCNRALWLWLRRRLRQDAIPVATVNLEPLFGGIDGFAEQLDARIEALLAETGADRVVLVTHSMGGLVARAYLRRYGAGRVARLIALAAPNAGTEVARVALGRNAREMEPNSVWLRRLAADEPQLVPTLSIWSEADEIVVPQDSSRLSRTSEKVLPALGHLAMVFSSEVADILRAELANQSRNAVPVTAV